jgi:hypothetical protein
MIVCMSPHGTSVTTAALYLLQTHMNIYAIIMWGYEESQMSVLDVRRPYVQNGSIRLYTSSTTSTYNLYIIPIEMNNFHRNIRKALCSTTLNKLAGTVPVL